MSTDKVNILYQVIINNSWTDSIEDYFTFIEQNSKHLVKNKKEFTTLFDLTLKKILKNLKDNIDINVYDNLIINMGKYANQDGFDFAIGLIKTYYLNEFIIDNNELNTIDVLFLIYNEYKNEDSLTFGQTIPYILASLFRIHYILLIKI